MNRIGILKQLMRATSYTRSLRPFVSDKRARRGVDRTVSQLWYQSYDELEELLDDEEFEDFLDTLD